jgi:hypothetical protein
MKTLIVVALGKIGKSIINSKSKNIIFTYNKNEVHKFKKRFLNK